MEVKPVSSKCCSFIKKKGGLLAAYFLLVYQSVVVAQAFYSWITKESALKIVEENKTISRNIIPLILSLGLALVLTIATVSFMIELVVDLHEIFQSIVMAQAFYLWITKESVLKILEENKMGFWNLFLLILSIGLVLILTFATISCIVSLLVDQHKEDAKLVKIYFFMFSFSVLTVTFLFYFNSLSK